jgi:hypothetical protein
MLKRLRSRKFARQRRDLSPDQYLYAWYSLRAVPPLRGMMAFEWRLWHDGEGSPHVHVAILHNGEVICA